MTEMMLTMPRFLLPLIVTLPLLHLVDSGGIDIGLCHDNAENCQCGEADGYEIQIPVKQCSHVVGFGLHCKDCEELTKEVRCAPYLSCLDCDPKVDGCSRCPPLKYGKWCMQDCTCKNGGSCDQDGKCICPNNFVGPICEHSAECPPPPPSSSQYQPQTNSFPTGTKLTYSCGSPTQLLEGPSVLECLHNAEWSRPPPECIPECPLVPTPVHGTVHLPNGRLKEGVTLNYSCKGNHRLFGNSERTCQKDGSWTGDDPVCELVIICENPDGLQFGNFSIHRMSSTDENTPGTTLAFTCNKGYVLIGTEYILCKDDGNWSELPPICAREDAVCPNMGELSNGLVVVRGRGGPQAYLPGTEVKFFCNPLHYMYGQSKTTCQDNGSWSSSKPVCIETEDTEQIAARAVSPDHKIN